MLARLRKLRIPGGFEIDTPLLVPSFSSKGFPDLKRIVQSLEKHIIGPVLVSAYDVNYKYISLRSLKFSRELLFVDSGGYESSTVVDFSAHEKETYKPKTWNNRLYIATIKRKLLQDEIPKVVVSYDHPRVRRTIADQIRSAEVSFAKCGSSGFIKEILLKPETRDPEAQWLPMDSIDSSIEDLKNFQIVGVTEKELGKSPSERMINLARLRRSLMAKGMDQFIHVFGSLDTITTPLYFMCGADIFDGLTWLRYVYHDGLTLYQPNYWIINYACDEDDLIAKLHGFIDNHQYLRQMLADMKNFQKSNNINSFSSNKEILGKIWGSVERQILGGR